MPLLTTRLSLFKKALILCLMDCFKKIKKVNKLRVNTLQAPLQQWLYLITAQEEHSIFLFVGKNVRQTIFWNHTEGSSISNNKTNNNNDCLHCHSCHSIVLHSAVSSYDCDCDYPLAADADRDRHFNTLNIKCLTQSSSAASLRQSGGEIWNDYLIITLDELKQEKLSDSCVVQAGLTSTW